MAAAEGGGTPKPKGTIPVTGPITGGLGEAFTASSIDLEGHGYSEKEFFYGGEAIAYVLPGGLTLDGKWDLEEDARAEYEARLLVRRPVDAKKFNGTVVIEWLNVSGGADGDPGFMYNWQELLREGYAWVGVSAQKQGIEGGGFSLTQGGPPPLKMYDPERYGSLSHPGDAYSFDIYTTAARIVRGEGKLDVLEGLEAERVIGYGESQSASRLVSYVNGVQPMARAFDGFFIHSRSVSGVAFTNEMSLPVGGKPVQIRDDLDVPVFQFQTETDVIGPFGYAAARQPDSDRLRTWEVAGTAHADAYILSTGAGEGTDTSSLLPCKDVNAGPQHYVIKAALHALQLWVADGVLPPKVDRLMTDASGNAVTDDHGNTLGGARSPAVDVPIATLSGQPSSTSSNILCSLFGHTKPFTADELEALYPTHDDYVTKVEAAAADAREAGTLLEAEEQAIVDEAKAAAIPK